MRARSRPTIPLHTDRIKLVGGIRYEPMRFANYFRERTIEEMSADGFVSLSRQDAGFNLIFLQTGLETFKPSSMRGHRADGLLIVFVVNDIDAEYTRLQSEGVI